MWAWLSRWDGGTDFSFESLQCLCSCCVSTASPRMSLFSSSLLLVEAFHTQVYLLSLLHWVGTA